MTTTRGDASENLALHVCPIGINEHWAHDFIKRHSDQLDVRGRRKLDTARAHVSLEALRLYYVEIGLMIARHRYPTWAIANMDETSLKVTSKGRRAVILRGMSFGFAKGDESAGHITLAVTIFADNTAMKPLAIVDTENLPSSLSERVARNYSFMGQPSGWMTAHIFGEWVKEVFVPEVQKRRRIYEAPQQRVLLLVDGHSSRANPDALQHLADHGIDVITPVAHSSHLCQPLDLRFLAVFKALLSGLRWRLTSLPKSERRNAILELAINALHGACRDDIIEASWRLSGICPLQPSVVLDGKASDGLVPLVRCALEDRPKSKGGLRINERVLTSPQAIRDVRITKEAAEARKRKLQVEPMALEPGRTSNGRASRRVPNGPGLD